MDSVFGSQYFFMVLWLVLMGLFLVVEIATPMLVSIWFVFGSIAALIGYFEGATFLGQLALFLGVSVFFLILTRPLAKYVHSKKVATNIADGTVGMAGVVKIEIDNIQGTGRVFLNGLDWSAKSVSGGKIEVGTEVVVQRLEGNTLFVSVK